ncbi:hypothetical protein FHR94_000447 [Halomonas cerina]|uniref:Uncharacterized protein n=1 Tax=Halomonas cerina TaxID=447424 RepID=A0A839V603_9GAMM|nr:hypothetical protein [Halomonas cerina]
MKAISNIELDLCRGRKGGISLSPLYAELGRREYQRG